MSAARLRTEMVELLAEIRSAGRGAFRSALDEVLDRRLPAILEAHDIHESARLSEDFRERLAAAVSSACAQLREGALPSIPTDWIRPRTRTPAWAWGFAAAAILLLGLLLSRIWAPKESYIAPREKPGITGPQLPVPKEEKRPQGPAVRKAPETDIRSVPIPKQRDREREQVVQKAQPVGEIGAVSGDVVVRTEGANKSLIARRGDKVVLGSIVDTGDMGRAEILLKDGSKLTLGFNTTLIMRGESGRDFELHSGSLVASVVRTESLDKFLIETPVATAEVLGTVFSLGLERKAKLQAVLQVESGRVAFYNERGRIEARDMTESTAVEDTAPTPPKRIARLRTYTLYYGDNFWLVQVDTSRLTLAASRNILVHPTGSTGIIMNGLPGQTLRAVEVLHGSAAARAGLRSGDDLLAINGSPTRAGRAGRRLLFRPAGERIRVTVRRGADRLGFTFLPQDSTSNGLQTSKQWALPLRRATDLLLKGDVERAISQLQELAAASGEAAAFNNIGVAYEVLDDMPDAIRGYKAAIEHAPDVAKYRLNLGLALQKIGNHQRSIEEMEEAVSLDPGFHDAILFLARAYSLVDRVEDALRVLEAGSMADPKCPHYDHARSITFMKATRYADAVEAAQRAVAIDPGNASMHGQLGRSLRMARQFPEAEAALMKAIDLDPAEVVLRTDLGTLLTDMRRFDDAEAVLRKALELDPNSANTRNKLGLTFVRRGRFVDAEREFRDAIRLDPKGDSYHNNLGGALLNQGRFKEAEESLLKAIELAPNAPQSYAYMGTLFFRRQRFEEAAKWYRQAAELEPGQMAHTNMLVQSLLRLNRPKDAVEARRSFVALNPDSFDGHYQLSNLLLQQEQFLEARDAMLRAIQLNPGSGVAYIDLGVVYMNLRHLPEAQAALLKGIELEPRNPLGYSNMGGVLYDMGRFAEAEPMFQRAAELQPGNPQWPYEIAMTKEKLGQPIEAEKMFRKAIELQPGNAAWHDYLAHFLDRQDRVFEAAEAYEAAAERNPNDPGQWSEYGWSLIVIHRWDEALQAYRKCLDIDSKGDYVLNSKCNLGFALIHLSRQSEAEVVLSEARKLKPEDAEAQSNWALLLATQGRDLDEALRLAQSTTPPDSHAQRFYVLGIVREKRREYDEAIAALERAASGFGSGFLAADAFVVLGQVYEAKKDGSNAIASYRRALRVEPGNKPAAEALKRLGG